MVPRNDLDEVERKIDDAFATEIRLPQADIQRWLAQFNIAQHLTVPKVEPVSSLTVLKRFIKKFVIAPKMSVH